jgi:hypothetical protein
MIFYSWTALSDSRPESSVAMGISDDRGRAMRAAEETLGSGRAAMVIIEAVRPAMAGHVLAPCYARTWVGWRGRRTGTGEVAWDRFFVRDNPDDLVAAGTTPPPDPGPSGSGAYGAVS